MDRASAGRTSQARVCSGTLVRIRTGRQCRHLHHLLMPVPLRRPRTPPAPPPRRVRPPSFRGFLTSSYRTPNRSRYVVDRSPVSGRSTGGEPRAKATLAQCQRYKHLCRSGSFFGPLKLEAGGFEVLHTPRKFIRKSLCRKRIRASEIVAEQHAKRGRKRQDCARRAGDTQKTCRPTDVSDGISWGFLSRQGAQTPKGTYGLVPKGV